MVSNLANIVLILWIPVCASLFLMFRPVRALTIAYLFGWLALPMWRITIPGIWDLDKVMATNFGVVIGTFMFCSHRLRGYRVNGADLAILLFTLSTAVTSLLNGLGLKDGVSSCTYKIMFYGVPFWFGRAFFRTREDLLLGARLIVGAACIYGILAVWEWRMSPQIHLYLYGFFQHGWLQHVRWGFFRPIVCFPHALGLGTFMAWSALLGVWMLRHRQVPNWLGMPGWMYVTPVLLGLLATMSMGPWMLFGGGLISLIWWRRTGMRWLVLAPVILSFVWMAGRYTGVMEGRWLADAIAHVSEERSQSIEYRVNAEDLLVAKAMERPMFGWGEWGRSRAVDADGRDLTAVDGMWIIFVGSYGVIGLLLFYLWWCWPVLMASKASRELERNPALMALLMAFGLQAVNFLFNGFLSPILMVMSGGAVSVLILMRKEAAVAVRQARARRWPGPAPALSTRSL